MGEYQVIARKWRPQSFGDVVGQQHVVRTLRNAISSGRIAHAYLFVGPRGIGKTTLARIFAKALNCEAPVNGEPCCKCASCQELAAERSLDVMEIDAASRNSTVDMRELAESALTRPVNGKYKIYIIDEVHMLSKAAWNVLLKTVEEPPEHVKFIFATTEVHQVLPTIISRCQRFDLMPIPTSLIAARLQLIADTEKVSIDPSAVNAIARAAEGGMRDAQSLLDQMIAFFAAGDGSQITEEQVLSLFGLTDRADMDAILRAILQNNPAEVVTRIAMLARRGKNLETLFDDLLHALRAVQLCTIMADPSALLDESPEALAGFRQMAQLAPRDTIQILLENVAPVGRILHDALNKQVYLETLLLKAMREAHAVRIGDILARLNQLRTADELKFLDQLPVVEKNFPSAALPEAVNPPSAPVAEPVAEPVAAPVSEPEVEAVAEEPAAEIVEPEVEAVAEEPAVEIVEPEVEPVSEPEVEAVAEVVAEEPVIEDSTEAETEAETEPENISSAEETQEKSVPVESVPVEEKTVEATIPPADDLLSDDILPPDDMMFDIEDEETVISMDSIMPKAPARESGKKESLAPDRLQQSIANEQPQLLHDVVKNNPVVAEAVDLFSGVVIDIHR